mgnify:CR=1 FL=1
MCFYILNFESVPQINVNVKIENNITIQVCVNGNIIISSQLSWIISGWKLQKWSQLQNILARYVDSNIDCAENDMVALEETALSYRQSLTTVNSFFFYWSKYCLISLKRNFGFPKYKSHSYN